MLQVRYACVYVCVSVYRCVYMCVCTTYVGTYVHIQVCITLLYYAVDTRLVQGLYVPVVYQHNLHALFAISDAHSLPLTHTSSACFQSA